MGACHRLGSRRVRILLSVVAVASAAALSAVDHATPRDELLDALREQAVAAALGATDAGESLLDGAHVRFALEGARNFRKPKSLGEFLFDGAAIVSFDPASRAALDAYLADCVAHAKERKTVRGRDVVTTHRTVERDEWTFHVARPAPDLVIGATDAAFLDDVFARIDQHAKPDLPPLLRDWRRLDLHAAVWAARSDPDVKEGAPKPALGYFFAEAEPPAPGKLRLSLRFAGPIDDIAKARTNLLRDLASFAKPLAAKVPDDELDFALDLSDLQKAGDASGTLLALIGHVFQR